MDATIGRDDNAGTGIIALARVEEEAEESTLAHSYARIERQAGCWEGCPGLIASAGAKRRRGYDSYIHCKQCSAGQGTTVYLCLSTHGK